MDGTAEYQISISQSDGILEIVVTGKVTTRNVSAFQKDINAIRAAKGDRIFLDVRLLAERSMDAFYPVRSPEVAMGKTAVVDLPENEQIKPRCENVAVNTPMEVKWFCDAEAAKTWLKST